MPKRSIDTPLAEITLRRYEKPYDLSKRELVRKLCLGLGILSPGDSRDVIVDVLYVFLEAAREQRMLDSKEVRKLVIALRKQEGLDDSGTAASNIRRQIRRLREIFLVEKIKNEYRITEFLTLEEIFSQRIEKFLIPSIIQRLHTYMQKVDDIFIEPK